MSFFIREITLSGFKSFAEKTTIRLQSGLNMIVGPNGCGKSNIVDAFSWAFGESQVKNLRSSVGTDIIFSGTEKRSGSFVAKVSFTLDNQNRFLKYDAPLITVKRQINKDNESEFFINNVSCRLKDIQQLFLDTGLGKNTYSILQQGRVDQIVVGKAEDRRILLEEAAGIRNTKLVIKESQSKLHKTNENLNRIEDILKEVYTQYEVLERQAQAAIQYKNLKEQIQRAEKAVFFLRLSWVRQKKTSSEQRIQEYQQKITVVERKLSELEEMKPSVQEDLLILQDEQENLLQKKNEFLIIEAQLTQKIELWKKEYQNLAERIAQLKQKQSIFSRLIQEKEGLAKDILQQENLLESPREAIEYYSRELLEQQDILHIQEIEYQNLLSHFFSKEKYVETEALKQILGEIKKDFQNYEKLKSDHNILYKQQFSLSSEIQSILKENNSNLVLLRQKYEMLIQVQEVIRENTFSQINFLEKENKILREYSEKLSQKSEMEDFDSNKEELDKKLDEQREKVQNLRGKVLQLEKQSQSFQEEFVKLQIQKEKFQQEAEFYKNSIVELDKDILDLENKQEEYQEYIEEAFVEYEKTLYEKEKYNQELDSLQSKQKKIQEQELNQQKQEKELRKQWGQYKEGIQKFSIEAKEVEIEQKLLLEEFEGRYLQFKEEEWQEYQSTEELLKLSQEELALKFQGLQHEIQKTKQELNQIGMVNFLAIEEFETVKQRYDFLQQNKQDIQQSQKDLLELIVSLQKQSEQDFLRVFHRVNEHLAEVFQIAFSGGQCQMKLSDPSNPLESGVEILAQPPGKKLQNLNLLSGGEKTMVALSILFSLFMVKPTPFCLMDEVDAALDEMNIERFLRILNRFKDRVQFMIITHNRTTAQKGDIFYGVTMQETGVSKVFSFLPDNKGS